MQLRLPPHRNLSRSQNFLRPHSRNLSVGRVGCAAPVSINARLPKLDLGPKPPRSQRLPQVRQKRRIAIPAQVPLSGAIFKHIANSRGRNRNSRSRGWSKQPGVKAQQRAIGARSLRKEQHWNRPFQPLCNLLRYGLCACPASAIHKQRPACPRKCAEKRPASDLRLRNQIAGQRSSIR